MKKDGWDPFNIEKDGNNVINWVDYRRPKRGNSKIYYKYRTISYFDLSYYRNDGWEIIEEFNPWFYRVRKKFLINSQ